MDIKTAFKFCPRCGTKFHKNKLHLNCPACGLSYYFNPKPVQSVILKNSKNEYLFVVRAVEPRKGFLDFPGGFVEEDENFEETSRRELKEELGIDVGELKYLSTHIDHYAFQGIDYKVTGVTYLADLPDDAALMPADDVAGFEFYKLSEIPMDRLAFPSMAEMLKRL